MDALQIVELASSAPRSPIQAATPALDDRFALFFHALATQGRKRLFVAGSVDGGRSGLDGSVSAYRRP